MTIQLGSRLLLLVTCVWAQPLLALTPGQPVPALSAPARDGQDLSLTQLRGHVVYIDFWASWCAPCREAMPALDQLYRRYQSRGLIVLGVNVDSDRKPAQRMLDQLRPTFPVVFDPQGEWPQAFELPAMPSGYLVDAKGNILFVQRGFRAAELPQLETRIKAALGEQP